MIKNNDKDNRSSLSKTFRKAHDHELFHSSKQRNIIWQALSENPSIIIPTNHHGHCIAKENELKQKEKDFNLFLLLLQISINTLQNSIGKHVKDLKTTVAQLYTLGGTILDDINSVQSQIDLYRSDHEIVSNLVSGDLKEKDIERLPAVIRLRSRYKKRLPESSGSSLEFILTNQLEYEQQYHIPTLMMKRDRFGALYNKTIAYAEGLDRNIKDAEHQYSEILSHPDDKEKVDHLTNIDENLQKIKGQSGAELYNLNLQKEAIINNVEEAIQHKNIHQSEKQLLKTPIPLDGFGL